MNVRRADNELSNKKEKKRKMRSETEPSPLIALPTEIWLVIFLKISLSDGIMAYSTNKMFRSFGINFELGNRTTPRLYNSKDLEIRTREKILRKKALTSLSERASVKFEIKTLTWLKENRVRWDNIVVASASFAGNITFLEQIDISMLLKECENGRMVAAISGHAEVLDWFARNVSNMGSHRRPWKLALLDQVGRAGPARIHVFNDKNIERCATQNDHLAILKWMYVHNEGLLCDSVDLEACRYGHLHILKWLFLKGALSSPSNVVLTAAMNGRLDILKWAHGIKLRWTKEVWLGAFGNGHFHILDWALEIDNPLFEIVSNTGPLGWSKSTCNPYYYIKNIGR
jgi:hypothetical protein